MILLFQGYFNSFVWPRKRLFELALRQTDMCKSDRESYFMCTFKWTSASKRVFISFLERFKSPQSFSSKQISIDIYKLTILSTILHLNIYKTCSACTCNEQGLPISGKKDKRCQRFYVTLLIETNFACNQ